MKKLIAFSAALAIVGLMCSLSVKNWRAVNSNLLAANVEALAQDESLNPGEGGGSNYWTTTKTKEEFFDESYCCYTIVRTTEVDCLPDGKSTCTSGTFVDVIRGHRYYHA